MATAIPLPAGTRVNASVCGASVVLLTKVPGRRAGPERDDMLLPVHLAVCHRRSPQRQLRRTVRLPIISLACRRNSVNPIGHGEPSASLATAAVESESGGPEAVAGRDRLDAGDRPGVEAARGAMAETGWRRGGADSVVGTPGRLPASGPGSCP